MVQRSSAADWELLDGLLAKWTTLRDDAARLDSYVRAATLIDDIPRDLDALKMDQDRPVTLQQAAAIGHYSVDHLQRLVAQRRIENVGERGRPRIRRRDIPRKPSPDLPTDRDAGELSPRRRTALAVINSHKE